MEEISELAELKRAVTREVAKVVVGQDAAIEGMLVALLAQGHALLEGVPGTAKTLMVRALSATLGLDFGRIQFTPDLMPSDVLGTNVFDFESSAFRLTKGPIFTELLLADEINRAPAKTQSALLEAMQEQQATIEGDTRPLPSPFIVLATQNPVEQAGTYPLPEAQIDRFLVRLLIGYPTARDERGILRRFLEGSPQPQKVLAPEQILGMQQLVGQVHCEDEILDYVVRLSSATRQQARIFLGASPRASLALVQAARARALVQGRPFVLPDDVKALAVPVLAHRLVLTPEAEMEGAQREALVQKALEQTPHRTG
jgi:MoxR-like ATPase